MTTFENRGQLICHQCNGLVGHRTHMGHCDIQRTFENGGLRARSMTFETSVAIQVSPLVQPIPGDTKLRSTLGGS
jgi:hypothetical protein